MHSDGDQFVLNLVKSCQSNFNFSNNLLKEDKKYLEELAQDIARKLNLHYNMGNSRFISTNLNPKF